MSPRLEMQHADTGPGHAKSPSDALDVVNCSFTFKCPKQWDNLIATDNPDVRLCTVCSRNVHLARTQTQLEQLAKEGRCVAVRLPPLPQVYSVGLPGYPESRPDEIPAKSDTAGQTRRVSGAKRLFFMFLIAGAMLTLAVVALQS